MLVAKDLSAATSNQALTMLSKAMDQILGEHDLELAEHVIVLLSKPEHAQGDMYSAEPFSSASSEFPEGRHPSKKK